MTHFNLSNLPDILKIEELSALIGKATTTIRTCATNAKYAHLIPRPFKLPGSRRLCWRKEDVLAWIQRANPVQPAEPAVPIRLGPPNKGERLAAERAGLTVKQWRAQQRHRQ